MAIINLVSMTNLATFFPVVVVCILHVLFFAIDCYTHFFDFRSSTITPVSKYWSYKLSFCLLSMSRVLCLQICFAAASKHFIVPFSMRMTM